MASKVHTDNPKHHAYVCVNKRERKKVKRTGAKLPLLTLLAREILYLYEHMSCGCGSSSYSYTPSGTKIIWDDCNHKTYRKMVKRANGTFRFVCDGYFGCGKPKHFKKPYDNIY